MDLGVAIFFMLCNAILSGCHDGCTAVVETKLELAIIQWHEADAEFETCVYTLCPPGAEECMEVFPTANPFQQ